MQLITLEHIQIAFGVNAREAATLLTNANIGPFYGAVFIKGNLIDAYERGHFNDKFDNVSALSQAINKAVEDVAKSYHK